MCPRSVCGRTEKSPLRGGWEGPKQTTLLRSSYSSNKTKSEVQDSSGSILHSMTQIVFGRQGNVELLSNILGCWHPLGWPPQTTTWIREVLYYILKKVVKDMEGLSFLSKQFGYAGWVFWISWSLSMSIYLIIIFIIISLAKSFWRQRPPLIFSTHFYQLPVYSRLLIYFPVCPAFLCHTWIVMLLCYYNSTSIMC